MDPLIRRIDVLALAASYGVELGPALTALGKLYLDVEERNARNTAELALPCHRGCDACCHDSVFLTPLEFLAAWDHLQAGVDDAVLADIVRQGRAIYAQHRELILALDAPLGAGETDHFAIAKQLHFRCPLLDGEGTCRVYPARELYARLFGASFNEDGGVYGCSLVGAHLAGRVVTLLRVRAVARELRGQPLCDRRQVYPYFIEALYGDPARPDRIFRPVA